LVAVADQLHSGRFGVASRSQPTQILHRIAQDRHHMGAKQLIIERMRSTVAAGVPHGRQA
jgi:hypothetical protein